MQQVRHTRFDKEHIKDCDVCFEAYEDFVEQSRIDEREFADEQEALDI